MSKFRSSAINCSIFEYGIFYSISIELSGHNSNRYNNCFGRFRDPKHPDRH